MTRIRTLVALVLALALAATLAACSDDSNVDPQTVIDETFNNDERVSSGDLSLSLSGSAEGAQSGSFEASLSGPFQGDPDDPAAIPQLDWTGSISGEGAGQSISFEGGLAVTEDNAYVEYGGEAYELGTQAFSQFKQAAEQAAGQQPEQEDGQSATELFRQQCEASIEAQGGDPAACDIDFSAWLTDLESEGTEDVEGTETDHVSGALDVETMAADLVELGSSVPGAADVPTEDQISQFADAVSEASFDLYSGTEDRILRGLDFNLAIDPSAIPEAEASGLEGLDLSFSLRIGAVNEEQTIEAPSDARPLEELLGQFGIDPSQIGGLGGLPGGFGGGAVPGGGGGGGSASDPYLDCLSQAQTPEEITACADEL